MEAGKLERMKKICDELKPCRLTLFRMELSGYYLTFCNTGGKAYPILTLGGDNLGIFWNRIVGMYEIDTYRRHNSIKKSRLSHSQLIPSYMRHLDLLLGER